jgi:hypothetical protein
MTAAKSCEGTSRFSFAYHGNCSGLVRGRKEPVADVRFGIQFGPRPTAPETAAYAKRAVSQYRLK